jgi:hypothetical protein
MNRSNRQASEKGGRVRKIGILLGMTLAWTSFLSGQTAPPKALSVRDQVNKALGGKVIRVAYNPAYPASSPTQRLTLTVDRNGAQSTAYIDYTVEGDLKVVHRRLYGGNNAVLWSLASPAVEAEPTVGYDKRQCYIDCQLDCRTLPDPKMKRGCLVVCLGSCDLIFDYPRSSGPIK